MSEDLNKSYYAVIPANVRYDSELPANAKLLYGEITALCNQNGYCWASNDYFAKLYKCEIRTIQRWLSKLNKRGYISVKLIHKENSKEVEKRYISLVSTSEDKNITGYGQKNHEGNDKNVTTPYDKNVTDNITSSFNNASNKKKERRKTGYDEILSAVPDEDLKELFYEYIKMRKLIKAPMTDRALTMLISKVNDLEPHSIENQKKLLEIAIMNNWKSVYPLRDKPNDVQEKQHSTQAEELLKMFGG